MEAAGHGRPPLPPDLGGKSSKHGGGETSSEKKKKKSKSKKDIDVRPGTVDAVMDAVKSPLNMELCSNERRKSVLEGQGEKAIDLQCEMAKMDMSPSKDRRHHPLEVQGDKSKVHSHGNRAGGVMADAMDTGDGKYSRSAARRAMVANSMALVPIDGAMDLENEGGSGSGEESSDGFESTSSEDAAMVDATSPSKEGKGAAANSVQKKLCYISDCVGAAISLRAGASKSAAVVDKEEVGRCMPGARLNASKGSTSAASLQHMGTQQPQDVCVNVSMETEGEQQPIAADLRLGAAPFATLGRKWSDVASDSNPMLKPSEGVIPMHPSSDPEAYDAAQNTVRLCDESREGQRDRFEAALVGRLFGRRLPYAFLRDELFKRWEKFGGFRMITTGPDCFMCLFDEVRARDHVLMNGPWIVAGQVVGVDKWSPQFSPTSEIGFITPVWVRLPGLPFDCWEMENLARILEAIGTPLWMDAATAHLDRGSFARACVKINLAKPLCAGLWLEDKNGKFHQPLLYEGLSMFCHKCGYVGHRDTVCPADVATAPPSVITTNGKFVDVDPSTSLQQILKAGETLKYGENSLPRGDWMIVGRRRRNGENREANRKAPPMGNHGATGDVNLKAKGMNGFNKFQYLQKNGTPAAETNVDEGSVSGEGRVAQAEPPSNSPMKQVQAKSNGKKEKVGSLSQLVGSCERLKGSQLEASTAVVQQVVQYAEPCLTPMVFACAEMAEPMGKRAKKSRGRDRFSPLTITTLAAKMSDAFEKSVPCYKNGAANYSATEEGVKGNRKPHKHKASGDSSSLVDR